MHKMSGEACIPMTMNKQPIRILLIEDDAINAELVQRVFEFHKGGHNLRVVGSIEEARACMQPFAPDLVISEWRLPDGLCLGLVTGHKDDDSYPLIVLTSHGDEQIAVEAMKSGVFDYIVKSDDSHENLPHLAERAVREWEALKHHEQTEKLQDLQKDVLEKIVLGEPRIEILDTLCLNIQAMLPESICSVMLFNEPSHSLNVFCAPSAPETLCAALNGLIPGDQAASCGTAAYTGKPVFVVDTQFDPRWLKYRDLATKFGIRACWSIPITSEKKAIWGTFAISHRISRAPTTFHRKLLDTASYMAGITIQKRVAEKKLRASEDRYRDLYESAPCAYFTSQMNGRIMSVNSTAIQLLGYSKEDLIGSSILDLYAPTPNGREKALELLRQTKEGKEIHGEELEIQRADGQRLWISLSVRLIRDSAQNPIGWRAIVMDITHRKQGEEALKLMERVFENSSDHLSVVGSDYRYQRVNPVYERVHQTPAKNIVGKHVREFLGENIFEELVKPHLDRCLAGEEVSYESWFRFKNGQSRFMSVTYSPLRIREHSDCIQAVVVNCRDLTHRKRFEETLKEKEQRLRRLLEERNLISQDLHDHILQTIYATGLIIASARQSVLSAAYPGALGHLNHAITQLNVAISEIRGFIEGLPLETLPSRSFNTELHSLVKCMELTGSMNFILKIEEKAAQGLSKDQTRHLLNIARESISNCLRHAHATAAWICLRMTTKGIRFAILDNGEGLSEGWDTSKGYGLKNMRARAVHMDGRLRIRTRTGKGTCVVIDMPAA